MGERNYNEGEQIRMIEVISDYNKEDRVNVESSAEVLDYFQLRDYVHKVSSKPVTKPKYSTKDRKEIHREQRNVSMPNIETVKTIYECNVCGTLLSERHSYLRGECTTTLENISKDEEIAKLRRSYTDDNLVTESINRSQLVKPLYQISEDQITDYFEAMDISSTDSDKPPSEMKNQEKLIKKNDNNLLTRFYNIENEIKTRMENFMKYTSGLNRVPPLYSRFYWGNCFTSITRPGALPHLSKNGVYYRAVDFNKLIPDIMTITITNPQLVKYFGRNYSRRRLRRRTRMKRRSRRF